MILRADIGLKRIAGAELRRNSNLDRPVAPVVVQIKVDVFARSKAVWDGYGDVVVVLWVVWVRRVRCIISVHRRLRRPSAVSAVTVCRMPILLRLRRIRHIVLMLRVARGVPVFDTRPLAHVMP